MVSEHASGCHYCSNQSSVFSLYFRVWVSSFSGLMIDCVILNLCNLVIGSFVNSLLVDSNCKYGQGVTTCEDIHLVLYFCSCLSELHPSICNVLRCKWTALYESSVDTLTVQITVFIVAMGICGSSQFLPRYCSLLLVIFRRLLTWSICSCLYMSVLCVKPRGCFWVGFSSDNCGRHMYEFVGWVSVFSCCVQVGDGCPLMLLMLLFQGFAALLLL